MKKKLDELLEWVENIKRTLTKYDLATENSNKVIGKVIKNKIIAELVFHYSTEYRYGNKIVESINYLNS